MKLIILSTVVLLLTGCSPADITADMIQEVAKTCPPSTHTVVVRVGYDTYVIACERAK